MGAAAYGAAGMVKAEVANQACKGVKVIHKFVSDDFNVRIHFSQW